MQLIEPPIGVLIFVLIHIISIWLCEMTWRINSSVHADEWCSCLTCISGLFAWKMFIGSLQVNTCSFEITACRTISIQFIRRGYVRLMQNLIYAKSVDKYRCLSSLPNTNVCPPSPWHLVKYFFHWKASNFVVCSWNKPNVGKLLRKHEPVINFQDTSRSD